MKIAVLFGRENVNGTIMARNGKIGRLDAPNGNISGADFHLPHGGRLEISFAEFTLKRGAFSTICNVCTNENPFAFNLRDVNSVAPVFIPEFRAAVVLGDDARDYAQVAEDVAARGLIADFTRFENEPEESYANAARLNRVQHSPVWLGLGRDLRMFRVDFQERAEYWGQVCPYNFSRAQELRLLPKDAEQGALAAPYHILFEIGHGESSRPRITRRLDGGVLPILRSTQIEQDIHYNITAFASLESAPLASGAVRGSEWQACYPHTQGCMLSPEEKEALKDLIASETSGREQEVVCCLRVEAINTGKVPRYAWFKAGHVRGGTAGNMQMKLSDKHIFKNGCSLFSESDKIYAVQRIDGEPMPDEEMAILLPPGGAVVFDLLLPHAPIPMERAEALMKLDFDAHLQKCRAYWQARLDSAGAIEVPEDPINRSIKAGLLHCDLLALGREPDGPVLPTIGWYSPIGTESAPIMQFFDSMGWHDLAERSIQFFLERQRPDGFIQNFARYESETGPLLWTIGEHYRYTRDAVWLKRVLPKIRKAADYLLAWRERNKKEEFRAKGFYGMVNGKVADPNDYYHSFFLNAGTYLGLKRMAEALVEVDPDYASRLADELPAYRADIRAGFYYAQARAPVFPLGDGSWAPFMPPWVEQTGGISLYADGGNWFSHGSFASRSCLTGPLWLIIGEVLEPDELGADFLIKTNQYPVTLDNAALSQPYYCRHDYAHIRRGEVKAFLKTYYNQITALQDREILAFWEHYHHASQYKTHEQAWFMMQTRWMLWREDGDVLRLLSAIPRAWLEDGREIKLRNVKSYFGAISLHVRSELRQNRIVAEVEVAARTPLSAIILRLPHPEGRRAIACDGGAYDPEQETVTLTGKTGMRVSLRF